MTIKRKPVFVGGVVLVLILALIGVIVKCGKECVFSESGSGVVNLEELHRVDVEVGGTNVTLAVFMIDPPVFIPLLYQKGDLKKELKQYPWLGALLFSRSGIEAFIPKEKWGDYAAFDWTEETYATLSDLRTSREAMFHENTCWSGTRRQVSQVVLCLLNGLFVETRKNCRKTKCPKVI